MIKQKPPICYSMEQSRFIKILLALKKAMQEKIEKKFNSSV